MNRQSFSVLEVEPRATSILGNCSATELQSQPSLLPVFYVLDQCHCSALFAENLWLGPLPSQGSQREQGWSLNKVAATASFVRRKSWVFHSSLISPMLPCYPWASTAHWSSPATHGKSQNPCDRGHVTPGQLTTLRWAPSWEERQPQPEQQGEPE